MISSASIRVSIRAAIPRPGDAATPRLPGVGAVLLAATLFALLPAPARAQLPDSTRAPEADSVYRMAPLQVEVLRVPSAGARVPFAVSAVGPGELAAPDEGAFLNEALVALPGLQIQNRFNFAVGERIMVRGFGSRSQFGVRGLRIFLDGIPATLPDGQSTLDHVDPAALGRVELLRGPAAALYGNGAGGVMLIRSRPAGPGDQVEAAVAGGSNGLIRASAAADFVRGDATSRVQFTRLGYGGFRANPVDGGEYGEAERWTFTGRHEQPLLGGRLQVMAAGVELDAENPGSLPADSLGDADRSAWGFNVRQGTGKEVRQLQLGARWSRELDGAADEVNAVVWGLTRDLENPIPTAVIDVGRTALGTRAQLGGDAGPLRWNLGVEVEAQRDDRRNFTNEGGTPGALTLRQDEAVTGVGSWLALRAESERGSLLGALRYDRIHFSVDDRIVPADGLDESGDRTLDAVSPSLGGQLEIGPLSIFGSLASFLQTPTTTELANRPDGAGGFNPELEPTRGWTFEGGVRGTLLDRVGWEVVGFRTELRDELIPFEVPSAPGRTFFRNAGESRYQGMEAALRAELPLQLRTRVAYTRVEGVFLTGDNDGNLVPGRAPNLVEALVAGSPGPVHWNATVRWVDDTPVNDANTAEAPAYWLVGIHLGTRDFAVAQTRWSPWVSVSNLLDEDYVSSVAVNAFGGRFFEPGPGRTFQLGVRTVLRPR